MTESTIPMHHTLNTVCKRLKRGGDALFVEATIEKGKRAREEAPNLRVLNVRHVIRLSRCVRLWAGSVIIVGMLWTVIEVMDWDYRLDWDCVCCGHLLILGDRKSVV